MLAVDSMRADLRPLSADLKPLSADFRPVRADFRPERPNEGTDGLPKERMSESPRCSTGLLPLRNRASKTKNMASKHWRVESDWRKCDVGARTISGFAEF